MNEAAFLFDLLVVFAMAGAVVYLFHRFRIPSIVGLLCSGILLGPHGVGLIDEDRTTHLLAEVGVVVLLFAVGLEFSLSRLSTLWKPMLAIGLPQVLLATLGGMLLSLPLVTTMQEALFVGMLVSLSSTAVVIKLISDRGELGSPHGKLSVTILLLQDLLVSVFIVVIPLLAPKQDGVGFSFLAVFQGLGVVALVLLSARYLLTPLLAHVVRLRNRELFFILLVLVCLGTASLTAWAGLSLALGAFLAGLALSESEYSHQVFSEVLPFRDTLSSLFFISIGMLLDLQFLREYTALLTMSVICVMTLKFLSSFLPTFVAGYPMRIAVFVGGSLIQIGEFSFLLADRGRAVGVIDPMMYQLFLATAVVTMVLTPLSFAVAERLSLRFTSVKLPWFSPVGNLTADDAQLELENHVIIVGYGISGRNLARVLRMSDIPYVILEMNPQAVLRYHNEGEPIVYGDCTRPSVLEHVGIGKARILVIAISDAQATLRAVQAAKGLSPSTRVMVRTQHVGEIEAIRQLGAEEVIPQDFVASVEIFSRVLRAYNVPKHNIAGLIERIRSDHYEALRALRPANLKFLHEELAQHADIESCTIPPNSPAVGKNLGELQLRSETGTTLLAVRRNGELLTNPELDFRLEAQDIAILFGSRTQIQTAASLLDPLFGK